MSEPNTPTDTTCTQSSLAETGLQPHIITGIFLQLIREHFSDSARIESKYLKQCVWVPEDGRTTSSDPIASRILIDPVYRWNLKDADKRPAVIVKRNQLDPVNPGAGMSKAYGLSEASFPEAGATHCLYFNGSHTLFCMANTGGVAETLATEVARYFYQYAPVFREEFRFQSFELAQIGDVSVLEEDAEHFAVPVTVKYTYEDSWLLVKQAPRLKKVAIGVETTG